MRESNLYAQLIRAFEQRLNRSLSEPEKSLIQWIAERQNNLDNKHDQ